MGTHASAPAHILERSSLALPSVHPQRASYAHAAASHATAATVGGGEAEARPLMAAPLRAEPEGSLKLTIAYPSPESSGAAAAVRDGSHDVNHGALLCRDSGAERRFSRNELAGSVAADGRRGAGEGNDGAVAGCRPRGSADGAPGAAAAAAASAPVALPTVAPHVAGATVFLSTSPARSAGARLGLLRASSDSGSASGPPLGSLRRYSSHGAAIGRSSLGDCALHEPKNLLLFPDTPEGHYAQITCAPAPRQAHLRAQPCRACRRSRLCPDPPVNLSTIPPLVPHCAAIANRRPLPFPARCTSDGRAP